MSGDAKHSRVRAYAAAIETVSAMTHLVAEAERELRALEERTDLARVGVGNLRRELGVARRQVETARVAVVAEIGPPMLRELAQALRDGAADEDIRALALALVDRLSRQETP